MDIYQERQEVAGKSVRIMDRNEQKERDKLFRQSLGKFFIDLSKLVFAGVVLVEATSLPSSSDYLYIALIMVIGLLFTIVLAVVGHIVLKGYKLK